MLKRVAGKCIVKETIANELTTYLSVQGSALERHFPSFYGGEAKGDVVSVRISDLTAGMLRPTVMDIKMGTRTFLEREVKSSALRPDLALKLHALDESLVSSEELEQGITKLKYQQTRERLSSSAEFGWRIDGLFAPFGDLETDPKRMRDDAQLEEALRFFAKDDTAIISKFVNMLTELRRAFSQSAWLERREVVGSSLLFVYDDATDDTHADVKMIDFAKTMLLPDGRRLSHRAPWSVGNREDGFLFGLDNLIAVWERVLSRSSAEDAARQGHSDGHKDRYAHAHAHADADAHAHSRTHTGAETRTA